MTHPHEPGWWVEDPHPLRRTGGRWALWGALVVVAVALLWMLEV